jgi:hypothetical protein
VQKVVPGQPVTIIAPATPAAAGKSPEAPKK